MTVRNIGSFTGRDVVQIYVAYPAHYTSQPLKQLKAFTMTDLIAAGSSQNVQLTIYPQRDLLVWRTGKGEVQAFGSFVALVARDAATVEQKLTFSI